MAVDRFPVKESLLSTLESGFQPIFDCQVYVFSCSVFDPLNLIQVSKNCSFKEIG